MERIIIASPFQGWSGSLEDVPDSVFAERMLGDGVAIQPLGPTLNAPCDGIVATLHGAAHAITIRSDAGAEILMHIGLETVALRGEGFQPHVCVGQRVTTGQPLISFDLAGLALAVKSLVTPVIVTNPDAFAIVARTVDQSVQAGDTLIVLEPVTETGGAETRADDVTASRTIVLPLVHGIHARPAARIGECARRFEADVRLVKDGKRASARSPIALLALGTRLGDTITLEATGREAEPALAALSELIESGMGEKHDAAPRIAASAPPVPRPGHEAIVLEPGQLAGVTASPGLVLGVACHLRRAEIEINRNSGPLRFEQDALDTAVAAVSQHVVAASIDGDDATRAIMSAHLAFLQDPALLDAAQAGLEQGKSAGQAWHDATVSLAATLRSTGDARLSERALDLDDLDRQVQSALNGTPELAEQIFPKNAILLADDLLPSELLGLDLTSVVGFCLERGGPTSHVAILAAGMGLPSLAAMGSALRSIEDGVPLALEADRGRLHVDPGRDRLAGFEREVEQRKAERAAAISASHDRCHMADGTRIEVFANLGSREDADMAVAQGAEGSGLLRTEFLFLDRATAPDEDEQAAHYQAVADALDGRPLIVRLLDIGGDKPVSFLPMSAEENPALGLRGIRICFRYPELLETQIRAILRVRPIGQCRIMVPMIASLDELLTVRRVVDKVSAGMSLDAPVEVGVMIETPAAAVTAELIASEADFLSVGTNDLTQYTLAMDRGNAAVAAGIDAMHPAVLRLIRTTCEGADRHGRWTGVCGSLASDLIAVPVLLGLGVSELSVTPNVVPEIKALIRRLQLGNCRALASEALGLGSPDEVRALAQRFQEDLPK